MKSLGEKKKVTPMRLFSLSLKMDVFLKSKSLKKTKTKNKTTGLRNEVFKHLAQGADWWKDLKLLTQLLPKTVS